MKRIVALLVCLFCSSLTWGQYQTGYQTGVSDITGHLSTVNAWHQLGSAGCSVNGLSVGGDGTTLCKDPTGHIWKFVVATQTWDQNAYANIGNNMVQMAVLNATNVYLLGPNGLDWATCQAQGHGSQSILLWNGSTLVAKHGCGNQLSAANGVLTVVAYDNSTWQSTDGAGSWAQISGGTHGPNLNYVSAAGTSSMCGTNGTQVFFNTGAGFVALNTQPASSGIQGCVITTDSDSIYAWGTFTASVKRFDVKAGTWNTVMGMASPHGMTSGRKGSTFALSNIGNAPYHLNVFAGFVQGTTTGSVTNCPTNPCPPSGVTHTGTIKVTLPHGLYGAQNQQGVAPNVNMNVYSFDTSPTCDPIYGDPSDPECQGLATGSVICSVSGSNFTPGGPSQPPHIGAHFSEWVGSYTGNYVIDSQTVTGFPPNNLLYIAKIDCAATDTCRPPTSAVCSPPRIAGIVTEGGAQYGNGATAAGALAAAVNGCKKHSITGGDDGIGPGAWGMYANYDIVQGLPPVCSPAVVFDALPYISACY